MAKNYSTSFRGKAVGMVHGGMRSKMVCKQLNISRSQLYRKRSRASGLPVSPVVVARAGTTPVTKRIIKLATGKQHQSTRKLSRRLTNACFKIFHATVHRYLRENIGLRPLKLKNREN